MKSRCVVRSFLPYYHRSRPHLSWEKGAPGQRLVLEADGGRIVATPQVGGPPSPVPSVALPETLSPPLGRSLGAGRHGRRISSEYATESVASPSGNSGRR